MSGIKATVAPRVFRCGALEIPDTNPAMPVDQAWRQLRDNYPHLKNALLSDPTLEAGQLVVTVQVPPVKVNG